MGRTLRILVPGGIYHVTARGNRRAPIVEHPIDAAMLLDLFGQIAARLGWRCLGYCVMTNHYHLVVETPLGDLSSGMHALNGPYARWFNRRHGYTGHLFEKRFHAVLVETDWQLLELCRYVVLNPVRAGLRASPAEWPWSSHPACIGRSAPPAFLDVDGLLSLFGSDRVKARHAFESFVENSAVAPSVA